MGDILTVRDELRIETLQGTILANEYLPGASRLLDQIRHVVAGRE